MATNSAMIGASRFPVGAPSTAQQNASAAMISAPQIGRRATRGAVPAWSVSDCDSAFQRGFAASRSSRAQVIQDQT